MGVRGRDSALSALLFVLTCVPTVNPQTSLLYQDLAADLTGRIVSAIPAGARISLAGASQNQDDDIAGLLADVTTRLTARGVSVVTPAEGVTAVQVACLQNLRERACTAEIRTGAARDVVVVTSPHDDRPRVEAERLLSIAVRPLISQRSQILDVALVGERLLVLDVGSVTLYQWMADVWRPVTSRPLTIARVWPRDPRGRLHAEGERFDAWLPGAVCSGGLAPLSMACSDRQAPWPIGFDNEGLDLARNFFTAPGGFGYYSVAPLGDEADAQWLVAGRSGALTWLDAGRQPVGVAGFGDDVAGLAGTCGADSTVAVVEHQPGAERDELRVFHAVSRRLVPAASPITLAGVVTALWSTPSAEAATVVVYNAGATRYEALQISIACGR